MITLLSFSQIETQRIARKEWLAQRGIISSDIYPLRSLDVIYRGNNPDVDKFSDWSYEESYNHIGQEIYQFSFGE